ncbi:MAG: MBL fold metallo-hydrolase [Opitutae bacterium]|nr:MBL fold metallo-hydrolase [Opitutae bacterium]
MTVPPSIPLEDELGDVLDKALCQTGLTETEAAARAEVEVSRLRDALDWRSELSGEELRRLARVLQLNEVGLCALGCGHYPLPEIAGLPFCLYPLRMSHGIGVVNAYIVAECGSGRGVLFDTGAGLAALQAVWPPAIRQIDAVFLTHVEAEHAGGLCAVVANFQTAGAFVPTGATAPCGRGMADGEVWTGSHVSVTAISTPGHVAAHNCYVVAANGARCGSRLLISGDLIFAGSVGCAFFCCQSLRTSIRRVLDLVPDDAVIAPGHGPLTTAAHERRYNPFIV